jgi:hypothetical protein
MCILNRWPGRKAVSDEGALLGFGLLRMKVNVIEMEGGGELKFTILMVY